MDQNYNLVLTGFMGVGKSTIGQIVAEKLGRRFVDMDELIVQRAGMPIPEIWERHGEGTFRAWEAAFCKELSEPQSLVISTGGGALVPTENLNVITDGGNVVIRLSASVQSVIDRLQGTRNRPLLEEARNPRRAILDLFEKRRQAYEKIRLRLDTTDREPEDIADEVIAIFQRELDRNAYRVAIKTPTGQYDLLCQNGLLDYIDALAFDYGLRGRIVVATNDTLAPLYGEKIVQQLPNAALVTIPDGEVYKTLQTVQQLYSDFVAAKLDRSGGVIALGGGVVGDTVGFAAATYMRGVKLMQIPTSLLAMVDSSVGGKVGVDLPEGKNLAGAFKQPQVAIIDPDVLSTLPEIETRCGLAEAVKHALLGDPGLLECISDIAKGEADVLRRVVQVKIDVVERDPYESGERAHLNLGHTFAHAIERVSHYQWRHGEAVGVGLVAAAQLSYALGKINQQEVESITTLVRDLGLPTTLDEFDPAELWEAMKTDKKWRDGRSHFIILEGLGRPAIVDDVSRETVMNVLGQLTRG